MKQLENIPLRFGVAADILGKKWTFLIIYVLSNGPKRFSVITSLIPRMSDKILGERLKELELEGIVQRQVYAETPVKIEYSLTEKGLSLGSILEEIQKWSEEWTGIRDK